MKLNSLRKKMMFYFITMTLMIGLISLYVSYNSKMLLDEIKDMFNTSITLSEIENKLEITHSSLTQYIQTKSSDALNTYIENSENLASSTEALLRYYGSEKGMLSVENVHNLVLRYNQYSADAVVAKRGRDAEGCRDMYQLAEDILKNIRGLIQNLKLIQLEDNVVLYKSLDYNSQKVQISNMVMIIDLIILTIMLVLHVTYRMTTPIIKLAHSANEIASGHFEGEEVIVSDEDEIQMMAKAFNKMRISIRNLIQELKKTNEVEAQLFEKELQTVKMQTLLNKAELRSLQSQINPHFLFNSLNAGVQLAMMEEADLTLEFLENMSAIFRYNIKPLDKTVTIEEELNNIKAYSEMMKVRFGDKLKFDLKVSSEVLPVAIMPLILQPLVENAFIHGIGKKEDGGEVFVEVWHEKEWLYFLVRDNGIGMTDIQMQRILNENNEQAIPKKSHSSGIGAGNVLQRLKLAYGNEICMDIKSTLEVGTEITITIPWNQVKGD
ncbi:sensor histidine kinase [Fusibacter bizertensis]|uniref:Sensor histidine kinase n=1 Tax=Fusibacter bizertensis TaxID=1488331 RepID=A0ABT6NFD6_9FIRM|nr:sensor histidine kinase [Fusibacter bizertensis]MDH8679093.1 sensor histidine kinase [Fusibacter bizertensis]